MVSVRSRFWLWFVDVIGVGVIGVVVTGVGVIGVVVTGVVVIGVVVTGVGVIVIAIVTINISYCCTKLELALSSKAPIPRC